MIYKIIVDKQPMTNPSADKKEYEIDIAPLYFKHDVYDSLVITHDEDYVMRRLELQDYNVLVELDPPVKEPLTDINIELFEGDNYIYLYDMAGNKIVAQYLVKNEFNELYVLQTEMTSAIEQSANAIELYVNGKIADVDGDIRDLTAELTLKVDKSDNGQIISMINASADEINLAGGSSINLSTPGKLKITSGNFKLDASGNMTCTNANISGTITSNNATITGGGINLTDTGTLASGKIKSVNSQDSEKYATFTSRGVYALDDYNGWIQGHYTPTQFGLGNDIDNNDVVDYGIRGDLGSGNRSPMFRVFDNVNGNKTEIYPTGVVQPSLEISKKNFEKLENGLDILKDIEIYKFNFKSEDDDTKKHIGFVIGDSYKYSKEITSKHNDGVDIYSFVSVCCKAIQEQQEEIEQLKARIEKLEKGDK